MGQWRHLVTGILEEKFHNQFTAKSADIKEVKTMNLKFSANQKNESNSPPEWQCHTAHQSVHKGGNWNNGHPILQLMTSWNTECDKLHCFTQVSYAKVESVCRQWKRLCEKILSALKLCTHDICKFHYNCNDTFWEKETGGITSVLTFDQVTWVKALHIPLLKCHVSLPLSLTHTQNQMCWNINWVFVTGKYLDFTGEGHLLIILMFVNFLFTIFNTNQLIYCIYDHNSGMNKNGF